MSHPISTAAHSSAGGDSPENLKNEMTVDYKGPPSGSTFWFFFGGLGPLQVRVFQTELAKNQKNKHHTDWP